MRGKNVLRSILTESVKLRLVVFPVLPNSTTIGDTKVSQV